MGRGTRHVLQSLSIDSWFWKQPLFSLITQAIRPAWGGETPSFISNPKICPQLILGDLSDRSCEGIYTTHSPCAPPPLSQEVHAYFRWLSWPVWGWDDSPVWHISSTDGNQTPRFHSLWWNHPCDPGHLGMPSWDSKSQQVKVCMDFLDSGGGAQGWMCSVYSFTRSVRGDPPVSIAGRFLGWRWSEGGLPPHAGLIAWVIRENNGCSKSWIYWKRLKYVPGASSLYLLIWW